MCAEWLRGLRRRSAAPACYGRAMFVRDVTRALDEAGVPYCIVGGLAVNLHGIPRTTFDVDVAVPREAAPLRACREVLEGLGLRARLPAALESLEGESDEALRARNLVASTFTDPANPLRGVDVLVAPPIPARVAYLLSTPEVRARWSTGSSRSVGVSRGLRRSCA